MKHFAVGLKAYFHVSQSHVQLLGHELRTRRNQILFFAPLPISCMTLNKLLSFTACVYWQYPAMLPFIICDTPFYTLKKSRNVTLVWVPVASGSTDWGLYNSLLQSGLIPELVLGEDGGRVSVLGCPSTVPCLAGAAWGLLGLGSLWFSHLQIRGNRNHLLHEKLGGGKCK